MTGLHAVRTVLMIQVLHSFVAGVLGVTLPLMMKERQINVVVVGFVFAAMPLIMQFGRMFFATFSDFWGRKFFFASNGFLGIASGLIYYIASTPLDYLFGKVVEGTKEGTLWAVNRALLLEEGGKQWRILVYLRAVVYVAFSLGSFLAGYLVAWLLFQGTMLLCAAFGAFTLITSLTLRTPKREKFSMGKALRFLDFRKKERIFKKFLVLFCVMGISFGLVGGFVLTWFLSANGFSLEIIGLILGVQTLLAGLFSYLFSRTTRIRQIILFTGLLFTFTFLILGFSSAILAACFMIVYGLTLGLASIGQEGILTMISNKESYGTDIGLLWTGFHIAESASLAMAGILISMWGFAAPFILTALTYVVFSIGAYISLKPAAST